VSVERAVRTAVLGVAVAVCAAAGGLAVTGSAAYATATAVTSLSVTKGSTAGLVNTVITGTGFSTVDETVSSAVRFGTVDAVAFLVLSDTQIAAKVPAATSAGVVDVRVTPGTGAGGTTSAVTAGDQFTYRAPITATAPAALLHPLGGSVLSVGVDLTLSSGSFAAERITATVNGTAATVAYGDPSHVSLTVPAGTPSATPASIMLVHDGVAGVPDTTHASYAAVISALSRTGGPAAGGGSAITVTGKGLTGATNWAFGTVTTGFTCTVSTDTSASCSTAPASAAGTAGPVVVSFTPAGGVAFGTTAGAVYTYSDVS